MGRNKETYFLIVSGLGGVAAVIASALHTNGQLALIEPNMDISDQLPILFSRDPYQLLVPFLTGLLYALLMIQWPQSPLRRVWDSVTVGIVTGSISGLMQGLFAMNRGVAASGVYVLEFGAMFFVTDLVIAVTLAALGGLVIAFMALFITPTSQPLLRRAQPHDAANDTPAIRTEVPRSFGLFVEVMGWYALGPLFLNFVLSTAAAVILISLLGLTGLPTLPLLILVIFIGYFCLTRWLEEHGKRVPVYWVLIGGVLGIVVSWGASFVICMMSYVFYGCDLAAVFTGSNLAAYAAAHVTAVLAFLVAKSHIFSSLWG